MKELLQAQEKFYEKMKGGEYEELVKEMFNINNRVSSKVENLNQVNKQ